MSRPTVIEAIAMAAASNTNPIVHLVISAFLNLVFRGSEFFINVDIYITLNKLTIEGVRK
jgi:hypothetical protein